MTPEQSEKLALLQATYPGCAHVETLEGLIVVRKPSSDETIAVEDAVGSLTDLGDKPNPYAGLSEIKAVVVHPSSEQVEELLQSYPEFFGQLLALMRIAAMNRTGAPQLQDVDLRDTELYMRESADEPGRNTKRAGGRIFAVEHYYLEADPDSALKQRRVVLGRYLMRRFGLIAHRQFQREVQATGYLVRTRHGEERSPRPSTWARIAREHMLTAPGCNEPDWEKHPYLLILLGQAVRDSSALTVGSSTGK